MAHRNWSTRSCPLCEDTKTEATSEIRSKNPAEEMSFDEVRNFFIGLRPEQVFFTYKRCMSCGLLYCPIYFDTSQLDILYREMPDNLMGEDKTTVSRTQSGYASWLDKSKIKFKSYLEIGPDLGLVASHVINKTSPARIYFVEPNRLSHSSLNQLASPDRTVKVVTSLEELNASDIELIYGVHVYDHLLDPLTDLIKIRELAAENSQLAIVVHNEKSALRRLLGVKWPPFCLQHPQLFNSKSVRELLQKSGWQVTGITKTTNWWHFNHIVATGLGILGLKSQLAKSLPSVEVPLKLGNMMIRAEKKSAQV